MGLKKTNYQSKNGYVYPEAYALFNGNIIKDGDKHVVYFDVHASRYLALNNSFPFETKGVEVKNWDRKTDLVKLAYESATATGGEFESWQNDIVY